MTSPAAGTVREAGAPYLVGVTGKRDLKGCEAETRAAFDAIFQRLDAALPNTPKILLSALASGADSVAAEAALARAGWRVVAPIPFSRVGYEADFTEPEELARFRRLADHPRVQVRELSPLRKPGSETPYAEHELQRDAAGNPERTLHYEQAGLFIAERCALLIGVLAPDETPDRIGGTARIVDGRLHGRDTIAADICVRSTDLLPESALSEPRLGPFWRILLDPARAAEGRPLVVEAQEGADREPLEAIGPTGGGLEFGARLDDFNRRAEQAVPTVMTLGAADSIGRLGELRKALSEVQRLMKARVRLTVWLIAGFFCLAVTSLEVHVAFGKYAWAEPLSLVYFLSALGAVALYVIAALRRWQPLAEDYRAVSEALRAQMVIWQLGRVDSRWRVDLRYLRGMRGALGMVRQAVGQLVEGALLWTGPPPADFPAVIAWIDGQKTFFHTRVATRRRAVGQAQTASWFLFICGLAASACVAAIQVEPLNALIADLVGAHLARRDRLLGLGAAVILCVALFLAAQALRRWTGRAGDSPLRRNGVRLLGVLVPVLGGLTLSAGLCDLAALLPAAGGHGAGAEALMHQAEELMIMGAVLSATFAGAIRFVAEKLSWEAELQGYEHTHAYFERASQALAATDPPLDPARREALVLDLVAEALQENESWLFAHRERPIEPVVG